MAFHRFAQVCINSIGTKFICEISTLCELMAMAITVGQFATVDKAQFVRGALQVRHVLVKE